MLESTFGKFTLSRAALAVACFGWACAHAQTPAPAVAPARQPAAASAVAATSAAARASTTPGMTLSRAYALALEQDAQLRMARDTADSRRERVPQAKAQLLPNISAQASRFNNHLLSIQPGLSGPVHGDQRYTSSNNTLQVRQALFRPYQFLDYRQAQAQVADANATLDKEIQNLAARVSESYMNALFAEDQLSLVLASKAAYTTQLEAAKKLFAGGSGVRTDVDQAQAQLDLAVAQELEARQNISYTRRQLQVLTNTPVEKLATVDADRLKLEEPSPPRLEDWTERAELISPELRSLRAQREAAQLDVEKTKAGHLPTLDLVGQWTISKSDSVTQVNSQYDNRAIGLQLSVPIFSGGYTSSQTRQALAELQRVEDALEATRRDLALRIEKEYRGVTEGIPRIRALEQAVRSADVAAQSAKRSFQAGSRTVVDVLNAETQQSSARRDLANARYNYMLSRIRLRALAGDADESVIAEVNGWLAP